ncbi:MAG TPA: hypothetical protein VM240_11370 [Verrucomicrobiae bacterium]|nr:hypothetical protein [Verrucomicrobiae bacterium]
MKPIQILGIVLIVAGVFGLVYGGFSFTKDRHTADLGPLKLSVDEKQHVNVPLWAGLGVLVAGVLLLVVPRRS